NSGAGTKLAGQSVSVTDAPPSGLTVTAMSGTGWTCTTLPTCVRSDLLSPSASYPPITVTVTVATNATSPQANSISVTTAQNESNPANNTATDSTVIISTLTWDGGGADNNWSTAANWNPDIAPADGVNLVFPSGAARLSNNNDISGLDVRSITVSD